jgi:elongation factor Ts
MVITADQVKQLREKTGAGIMDSKRALQESGGDMGKAESLLKQQGLAKAGKKGDREALQGVVEPYVHGGGRIGAIVEVNCETDFVARTADFKALAHDIAMQVTAMNPRYVTIDQVPDEAWSQLEADYGSRDNAAKAVVLMEQPFIRDGKNTIGDLVKEGIAKLGENIQVTRFSRFELGADRPASAATETEA